MFARLLQYVAWAELILCWIAWSLAFVRPRRASAGAHVVLRASSSRLGIFLCLLGFAFVCAYVHPLGLQKPVLSLLVSMAVGPISVFGAWAAARELGRFWRYEAALTRDHQLITTGPYAYIRHPIYGSMLGMMIATGTAYTWWPMFAFGLSFFLLGLEIRIHAEDKLLEQFFQDEFFEYRERVPKSFVPFLF